MNGFKNFLMRGNVIELATAVIIGAAFGAIVDAFVEGIANPLIAVLFNAESLASATLQLGPVNFGIGLVLSAIIKFILVAAVLYFAIVLPYNKVSEAAYIRKHGHPPVEEEAGASEVDLLTEIRDLLSARNAN